MKSWLTFGCIFILIIIFSQGCSFESTKDIEIKKNAVVKIRDLLYSPDESTDNIIARATIINKSKTEYFVKICNNGINCPCDTYNFLIKFNIETNTSEIVSQNLCFID